MPDICPRDFKVCIDDLCRGSGTCLNGESMLARCWKCGEIEDTELGIYCNCEPEYYDDYEDEDPQLEGQR